MKKLILVIIYLFYATLCLADEIDKLMAIKPIRIEVLPYKKDTNIAYLQTPFVQAQIIKKINANILKDPSRVFAIHLVYTKYREIDSFNQPKLNYYRYQELKKLYPELIKNPNIHWKVFEQIKAKTKDDAAKCFHGFVIYLKNEIPVERINEAINIIKDITDSYKDSFITIPSYKKIKVKKIRERTGIYLPNNTKKRKKGITYSRPGIWGRTEKTKTIKDTLILFETPEKTVNIGDFNTTYFENIDVYNTLRTLDIGSTTAIVIDVTGSMAPFSAEVMLWIKNRKHLIGKANFSFFNDGNNEPDQYKKIGKTGGIYKANNTQYDSIFNCMALTMRAGTGGFPPENYCEAIIQTIKWFPNTDTVVVIADISASASDIELLSEIKKPVHIVFAGTSIDIDQSYYDLANKTNGSIFYKTKRYDPKMAHKSKKGKGLVMDFDGMEFPIVPH